MKNKIIAILMAGAITLSLTACGSSVVNNSDDVIEPTVMFERYMIDKYYFFDTS